MRRATMALDGCQQEEGYVQAVHSRNSADRCARAACCAGGLRSAARRIN